MLAHARLVSVHNRTDIPTDMDPNSVALDMINSSDSSPPITRLRALSRAPSRESPSTSRSRAVTQLMMGTSDHRTASQAAGYRGSSSSQCQQASLELGEVQDWFRLSRDSQDKPVWVTLGGTSLSVDTAMNLEKLTDSDCFFDSPLGLVLQADSKGIITSGCQPARSLCILDMLRLRVF